MEEHNRPLAEKARRIDRELRTAGCITLAELSARTTLTAEELLPALGWLACKGRGRFVLTRRRSMRCSRNFISEWVATGQKFLSLSVTTLLKRPTDEPNRTMAASAAPAAEPLLPTDGTARYLHHSATARD